MNPKLKYYTSLDGLRAIAALAVIIAHFFTFDRIGSHPFLFKLAGFGNSGVSLFFVLSGFVITRILINSRNSPNYFKSFYTRRVLRIFPLYYFALLCYYLLPKLYDNNYTIPDFSEQLDYWLYLQNFARTFNWQAIGPGHFWSLAVEEHFYLLWPAILYLTIRKNLNTLLITSVSLVIMPLVLRYFMLKEGFDINVFTFTRLDQLSLGAVLAILERKGLLKRKQFVYYLVFFVLGLVAIACTSTFDYFNLNLFKHYAFGFCYFGLIGICAVGSNRMLLNLFLTNPIMQYLGKISYGIYVWHVLILDIVDKHLSSSIAVVDFTSVLLLTILISALSFKYLESPFLKLKKRFSYD